MLGILLRHENDDVIIIPENEVIHVHSEMKQVVNRLHVATTA